MLEWNLIWEGGFTADDLIGAALLAIFLSAFVARLLIDAERLARAEPPLGTTHARWLRRIGIRAAGLPHRTRAGARARNWVGLALLPLALAPDAFLASAWADARLSDAEYAALLRAFAHAGEDMPITAAEYERSVSLSDGPAIRLPLEVVRRKDDRQPLAAWRSPARPARETDGSFEGQFR